MSMIIHFQHIICRVCGLAWKETLEMRGYPRTQSTCPRCNTISRDVDIVKRSAENYNV